MTGTMALVTALRQHAERLAAVLLARAAIPPGERRGTRHRLPAADALWPDTQARDRSGERSA